MTRWLTTLLLLAWTADAHAKGMVVGPGRVEIVLSRGESQTTVLTVTNTDTAAARYRLSVVAFDITETGRLVLGAALPADSPRIDWIEPNPQDVQVDGGQAVAIRVQVTAPAGSSGTVWGGVLIEIPPVGAAKSGFGVVTQPQVLVPIYLTIRGTETRSAEVSSITAHSDPAGALHLKATLHNTGNTLLRPAGTWLVEQQTATGPVELASIPFSGEPVLPGHERKFEAESRGSTLAANLTASVFFDFGMEKGQLVTRSTPVLPGLIAPERETEHVATVPAQTRSVPAPDGSGAGQLELKLVKDGIRLRGGGPTQYRSEVVADPPSLLVELVGYRILGPRRLRGSRLVDHLDIEEVSAKPVITRLRVRFRRPVDAKVLEQPDGLLIQLGPEPGR